MIYMNEELKFELRPVVQKPRRKFFRKSQYDLLIDQFIKSDEDLASVEVEGKKPSSLRLSIGKRIKDRGLQEKLKVSVINEVLYLEKIEQ